VGDEAQLLALRLDAGTDEAGTDDAGTDTAAQEPGASWPPPGPRRVVEPPAGVDPRPQNIEPERAEPPEGGPGVATPRPAAEDVIEQRSGTPAPAAPDEISSPSPADSPAPEQPASAAEAGIVELTLAAGDLAWDRNELRVPAGATVRLTVVNRDRTPHDFALYRTEAAEELLFSGEPISGPDVRRTYEFAAPAEPGEYDFRCELHPERMTGAFIVE
jgi:plastocyanin